MCSALILSLDAIRDGLVDPFLVGVEARLALRGLTELIENPLAAC